MAQFEKSPDAVSIIAKYVLIAAQWADSEESTRPRITRQARRAAEDFVRAVLESLPAGMFKEGCEAYVLKGLHPDCNGNPCAAFGFDLYLTTTGHGVGFWDRNTLLWLFYSSEENLGEALTRHCEAFNCSIEQYRGWLYFHWNKKPLQD